MAIPTKHRKTAQMLTDHAALKARQDAAYKRTEKTIAKTYDSRRLTFSAAEFNDLTILPPEIGALTALTHLYLRDTQVSDLSPLLPLTQLAENPDPTGLSFHNTAATRADPRIAEIAGIDDNAKRAIDLFASLKDLVDTRTKQYSTLLSTRLMRASIGDFQFDDLTRVMRLMPF